jgi:hypothetical protein
LRAEFEQGCIEKVAEIGVRRSRGGMFFKENSEKNLRSKNIEEGVHITHW